MRIVSADEIDAALDFPTLVEALASAFAGGVTVPVRHHHDIARPGAGATLLIMPAWSDEYLAVKSVTIYPDNEARGLTSLFGVTLLADGATGVPLAVMDGARLTSWRTAATAALASRFLSRPEASHLVMVGAGALAPFLIRAHAAVRPIRRVTLWNRTRGRAEALAEALADESFSVAVADDLEIAVRAADIVCCATLARAAFLHGAWLKSGAHLDLVGAFNMAMREADDEALRRASVFVDTPAAATEGGDVAAAVRDGIIDVEDIRADLAGLCRGTHPGRSDAGEITLFKAVGTAVGDFTAAVEAWRRLKSMRMW